MFCLVRCQVFRPTSSCPVTHSTRTTITAELQHRPHTQLAQFVADREANISTSERKPMRDVMLALSVFIYSLWYPKHPKKKCLSLCTSNLYAKPDHPPDAQLSGEWNDGTSVFFCKVYVLYKSTFTAALPVSFVSSSKSMKSDFTPKIFPDEWASLLSQHVTLYSFEFMCFEIF